LQSCSLSFESREGGKEGGEGEGVEERSAAMAWLNRTTIHVMVSVLAGITIQRPDGVVWDLAIAGNVASGFQLLAPA
jgi:hypothetical protein